jgi:hypothetical protein
MKGPGNREKRAPIHARFPPANDRKLCELLGAWIGDGWIGLSGWPRVRKQVCICGNLKTEREYRKHLQHLILTTLHVNGYYQERKKNNTYYIIINSNKIFDFFRDRYDFPIGCKRYFNTERLPKTWILKRQVIRGIFDTDGSLFFDNDPRYRCPYPVIDITLKNREVLDWITEALHQRGYSILRGVKCIRIKGRKSLHKWFKEISPKNDIHRRKYIDWKKDYDKGS